MDRTPTRRRSQLEISLCILTAVRDGVSKPTRIMYKANLSWQPLNKKLNSLVSQGLIAVEHPDNRKSVRRYTITDKGTNVLEYFAESELTI